MAQSAITLTDRQCARLILWLDAQRDEYDHDSWEANACRFVARTLAEWVAFRHLGEWAAVNREFLVAYLATIADMPTRGETATTLPQLRRELAGA
jgi:hypothetical protein